MLAAGTVMAADVKVVTAVAAAVAVVVLVAVVVAVVALLPQLPWLLLFNRGTSVGEVSGPGRWGLRL